MRTIFLSLFSLFSISSLAALNFETHTEMPQTPLPWEEMLEASKNFNGLSAEQTAERFRFIQNLFSDGKQGYGLKIIRENEAYVGHVFFFEQPNNERRFGMIGMQPFDQNKKLSVLKQMLNDLEENNSNSPKTLVCTTHPAHFEKMQPLFDMFGFTRYAPSEELLENMRKTYPNEDFSTYVWSVKLHPDY